LVTIALKEPFRLKLYRILATGPIVGAQYTWAIVSDPLCASLFVLSRVPYPSPAVEHAINSTLVEAGFDLSEYHNQLQAGCWN
jgi:lipocalin